MRIDGKNVLANPVEKFLAFGKQNMGKPAILDGNLVLVKNSMFWRLCLFTSIIIAVFSQYVFAALPWFISIGLLCVPFLIVAAFLGFGELYVEQKASD